MSGGAFKMRKLLEDIAEEVRSAEFSLQKTSDGRLDSALNEKKSWIGLRHLRTCAPYMRRMLGSGTTFQFQVRVVICM